MLPHRIGCEELPQRPRRVIHVGQYAADVIICAGIVSSSVSSSTSPACCFPGNCGHPRIAALLYDLVKLFFSLVSIFHWAKSGDFLEDVEEISIVGIANFCTNLCQWQICLSKQFFCV